MESSSSKPAIHKHIWAAIIVAALGYFVDVYDLVLFSVVRVPSLTDLGYSGETLLSNGVYLLNMQMGGMLAGGIFWGVLGDKRGRVSVLFGSILLYSLANLANAHVHSVEAYGWLRLLAGLGLAGELGAGITLVSEMLPQKQRGIGTTLVAAVGVSGALLAAVIGESMHWRTAYTIGGAMGLCLLALRLLVHESGMFKALEVTDIQRGSLTMLLRPASRLFRYLNCIGVGLPIWFAVGILVTFGPEIAKTLGVEGGVKAGTAILYTYIGFTLGDVFSGVLSQVLHSRKKAIAICMLLSGVSCFALLNTPMTNADTYYVMLMPIGFFMGYWAVFVTTAAEQFGTNLRATVATTVPNFVRGTTILATTMFAGLKPHFGPVISAEYTGIVFFALATISLFFLRESFSNDLNYTETHH